MVKRIVVLALVAFFVCGSTLAVANCGSCGGDGKCKNMLQGMYDWFAGGMKACSNKTAENTCMCCGKKCCQTCQTNCGGMCCAKCAKK